MIRGQEIQDYKGRLKELGLLTLEKAEWKIIRRYNREPVFFVVVKEQN